jgi:dynein heavy chain
MLFGLQNNLTELKSFGTPPPAVTNVTAAVMCLLAPGGKVPKDKSWKNAKSTIMSKVNHIDHIKIEEKKHHYSNLVGFIG